MPGMKKSQEPGCQEYVKVLKRIHMQCTAHALTRHWPKVESRWAERYTAAQRNLMYSKVSKKKFGIIRQT